MLAALLLRRCRVSPGRVSLGCVSPRGCVCSFVLAAVLAALAVLALAVLPLAVLVLGVPALAVSALALQS